MFGRGSNIESGSASAADRFFGALADHSPEVALGLGILSLAVWPVGRDAPVIDNAEIMAAVLKQGLAPPSVVVNHTDINVEFNTSYAYRRATGDVPSGGSDEAVDEELDDNKAHNGYPGPIKHDTTPSE